MPRNPKLEAQKSQKGKTEKRKHAKHKNLKPKTKHLTQKLKT